VLQDMPSMGSGQTGPGHLPALWSLSLGGLRAHWVVLLSLSFLRWQCDVHSLKCPNLISFGTLAVPHPQSFPSLPTESEPKGHPLIAGPCSWTLTTVLPLSCLEAPLLQGLTQDLPSLPSLTLLFQSLLYQELVILHVNLAI
jgi:hypothetical protein